MFSFGFCIQLTIRFSFAFCIGSSKILAQTGLIITYQKKTPTHVLFLPLQHQHRKIQTGINPTSESRKILHKHTKMSGSIQMKIYISQLFLLLVLRVDLRWALHGTTEDGGGGGGGMTGGNNLRTPEASGQAHNSGTGEKVAA